MQLCDLILFALVSQSPSYPACCLSLSFLLWFTSNDVNVHASCLYSLWYRDSLGKKHGALKHRCLRGGCQVWKGRGRSGLPILGVKSEEDVTRTRHCVARKNTKAFHQECRNVCHQLLAHLGLFKKRWIFGISINLKWSNDGWLVGWFLFKFYSGITAIVQQLLLFRWVLEHQLCDVGSRDAWVAFVFIHYWCTFLV